MKRIGLMGWLMAVCAISAGGTLFAAEQEEGSADERTFQAVELQFAKLRGGRKNETPEGLKARHDGALEVVAKAKVFLKEFPESKKADDAKSLWNLGLLEAAMSGDERDMAALDKRVEGLIADPAASDDLKLHGFLVRYEAQWAKKNGRRSVDEGAKEGRLVFTESLFAAADALPKKEPIFRSLLLQAKSGYKLERAERVAIAERIRKHPNAPAWIKTEASRVISGEPLYEIGKPVDLQFTALDGRKVDLRDLKGKVVLVDFWATWCGPCVAAFPALKAVYDKLHDQGLEVIGISLDEDKEALEKFLSKQRAVWPEYFDGKGWNNEISFRFGINAVPTLWVLDQKGNLRFTNYHADEHGLTAIFEELNKQGR